MSFGEEIRDAVKGLRQRVGPATVAIGRDARGSGIVIAAGQVLTNAHNLRDHTTTVRFGDGRVSPATVAGADVDGDLVVLTVDTAGAHPIEWADAAPDQGDLVFTVARDLSSERVTLGFVSAVNRSFRGPRGRRIDGSVEHTAPLARGSSGGPLVDGEGRLLGLNTHRSGRGFYLAVLADASLRARVEELAQGRFVERRRLGVAIVPSRVANRLRRAVGLPERDGLLVRGVEQGSPAAAAGLREGDLLVRARDRGLVEPDDLFAVIDGAAPEISFDVVRGLEELTVTVSFAS